MTKHLLLPKKGILILSVFLICVTTALAQNFQKGIRKGMIKVKFTASMTKSLNSMTVTARSSGMRTGLETLDATAKLVGAKNMYRLFPYDARFEAKLQKHGLHLWYIVELNENEDPTIAKTKFRQLKEVAVAEEEHEKIIAPYNVVPYTPGPVTYDVLPFNDPLLKDQWHYNNTGQTGLANADINLFEAWTKTTGANNIIVSVHDEGVDVNHVDLKENIWVNQAELNGAPNVDDDANGYIDDIHGYNFEKNKGALDAQYHGTHVSGTIAALNNNGVGVSGVAGGNGSGNGVKIMSLQILGGAAIEKSYVYAANNGAVISQNSWGYSSPYFYDQSVLDAIDYFVAEAGDYPGSPMKGGIVIFAAGNSNADSEWYPGYHASALSVASIGPDWKKASYSNFGAWIEVSAPGGEINLGSKNGVLSTIPSDKYAYLQGTSMACPHVSGIAALALANRTRQLTRQELWNKLVTGVVTLDEHNPEYVGSLGTGAIDASLAIENDLSIAPQAITNLIVTGIAQEFATLSWTVPADEDDNQPLAFDLYYHTQPITTNNLIAANKINIKNSLPAGAEFSFELNGLLGLTNYYFGITSTDRWGNVSVLSNIVAATTNEGPSIAIDETSQNIAMEIDVSTSVSASHYLTILNNASGILRWNHFMRHTTTALSFNAASLHYPTATKKKNATTEVLMRSTRNGTQAGKLRSTEPEPLAFSAIEKTYASWPTNIIGDTDAELTNSAAAKFLVSESAGFNLTNVRMYLKHDPALGPVILDIYKGDAPIKENLVYAQEHNNWSAEEAWANITLNEQLYFETGSTFWLAFHVPAGNLFPLGIGFEDDPAYSTNCFMSFNMGATWAPLESLINNEDFAWTMSAVSYNEHLGTYLVLEPGSGDVAGLEQAQTTLTADATTLVNGNYNANLIIASNDAQNRELRIPLALAVIGQQPKLKHIDIADYGSVFKGTAKTLELVIENIGYGNFNDPNFSIDNPDFTIVDGAPWQIKAREEAVVKIKLLPTTTGNINGILSFTNGAQTYQISLFGVGAETTKITITPETQTVNNVTIGDVVNAQVTIQNTGAYPLKYFIPGYDTKGISDNWPSGYHSYGYKFRTSYASESNPIPYEFQDISTTGVNIIGTLKDHYSYFTLDMGFEFPFYGEKMTTIYIAQQGFTTFDNSVNPINIPRLPGNEWSPKGYISPLGTYLSYVTQGEIFYQVEADRVIIQYDNVWSGWDGESITAQMVLYANGDIRFFYDNMGFSLSNQQNLSILMEDLNQHDGILIHDYSHPIELYSGLALGFDYPGPNIISKVTHGSGILSPGSSAVINLELSTSEQVEGTIKRYINFISNDPAHPQTSALVQLEITNGGTPQPIVSTDTIAFGHVFQGAIKASSFTIKNPGTASVDITNMTFVNGDFTLTGDQTTSIKPGLYKKYDITVPTASIANLEDWLSIHYADGTHDTVYITSQIVVPPAITIDLSLLQETLAFGNIGSHPLTIENPGLAPLEVVATGKQWLSFEAPSAASSTGYAFEKHNTGDFYQWIDIRKTGTQLQFWDFNDESSFWRTLELPFPIEYYGTSYTSFKIGDNGIISFEDEPQASFFTDHIPSQIHPGPCIMPYWTFSGFSDYLFTKEDIGIFYQSYDDKFIITWSYFTNNFGGMGDPVSAQVVFYKNGTMKFQYKREEGGVDLTSHFGTIGLQKNSTEGMAISEYLALDHGTGLAYIIVPAKKYVIEPGTSLAGEVKIDATNIYGGVYSEKLKIQTNVPGSAQLEKPIELTVTGDAQFTAAPEVDFGSKMIVYEMGSPVSHYTEFTISNEGAAPLDINWIQMADGTQGLSLQIFALVNGWFGPEWRWADIAELYSPWAWETPVFSIKPGDALKARAIFTPSLAGDFTDDIIFTSNIGETRIVLKGNSYEPPVIEVDATPIHVFMNATTETTTSSIAFNNVNGQSELSYEVSIDFGRTLSGTPSSEAMGTGTASISNLQSEMVSSTNNGAKPMSTYNRILKHTTKDVPDTHIGTGGSAPFTLATKYNAGPQGFNLTHVETWFRAETLAQGTIDIEVRAGSNSISNATIIAEGSLNFSGADVDNSGSWHQVLLNHTAGIYPNEDFYVTITYPLGIQFPQGSVTDEATIPGQYLYSSEGLWYDLQESSGFETAGWLMYAAEETAGNSSWLTISSNTNGTMLAGEAGSINLLMEAAYANRGDQVATILIKSNDPNNTTIQVPVTLHMNEAPQFINAPESIMIQENQTITLQINVTDAEENSFSVVPAQAYPGVSPTLTDGILSIALAPAFGTAGSYTYTFIATDEHNASQEMTVRVEVLHTNQAPVYIAATEVLEYNGVGKLIELSIDDFFADPDGDSFSFSVSSANSANLDVFASADQFIIKTLTDGETNLTFTVTDALGAVLTKTILVKVNVVLGVEPMSKPLKAYPNPVQSIVLLELGAHWEGEITMQILDGAGKIQLVQMATAHATKAIPLNLAGLSRGLYILKISSKDEKDFIKLIKE